MIEAREIAAPDAFGSLRLARWEAPVGAPGRVLLAQFDGDEIVVYRSVGEREPRRTIELDPSFVGLMARTGWGTAPGAERTLAIRVRRAVFDELVCQAVAGAFEDGCFPCRMSWRLATRYATVLLRWADEIGPTGPTGRQLPRLSLRDDAAARFLADGVVDTADVTALVVAGRAAPPSDRSVPEEAPYPVESRVADRLLRVPA